MNAVVPASGAPDVAHLGRRILWISPREVTTPEGEDILRRNGYLVQRIMASVDDALIPGLASCDLAILELASAEVAALSFCRRLSDSDAGAVLVIAPRIGVLERVAILEFGADGVLPDTVHPIELLARARALLRRTARQRKTASAPSAAEWRFEVPTGHLRSNGGGMVQLSPADAELLLALAVRPGQLVDRATLVRLLHEDSSSTSTRSIDARVARLRRALSPCEAAGTIRTVRGRGYLWEPSAVFQLVQRPSQGLLEAPKRPS